MNNTTLLNKLLKIEKNNSGIAADPDFRNLLAEVKQEIYSSTKGFSSTKAKASKKALSFLNKIPDTRPVLKYTDIQNINGIEYQVFTDSYMAFYLADHYCLPGKDEFYKVESGGFTYPNMSRLLPEENDEIAMINFDHVLSKLKAKLYEDMNLPLQELKSKTFTCYFDARRLKTMVEILGTTDITIYLHGNLKPALFVENGSNNRAILLPVRRYD